MKSREQRKWEELSPDTMSEEEENDDDGTFIRHRYSWRSTVLNNFIDKLEQRVAKSKKTLARKRVYGTQLDQNPPANALEWMKVDTSPTFNAAPEESGSRSSNELFSSEDDTNSNVANN